MAIITLTTDYGLRDHYVAMLKGKILSLCAQVNIIDVSHNIQPFDIQQAAFVLKNAYQNFPPATIHLINVFSDDDLRAKCIVAEYRSQYFTGADNGIFSLIFEESPARIIELQSEEDEMPADSYTSVQQLLCKTACKLANGTALHALGRATNTLNVKTTLNMPEQPFLIRGSVIYIDHYGNAITNIMKNDFEKRADNKIFSVIVNRSKTFSHIGKSYGDVQVSEKVCFFNSTGNLEIAINQGNAHQLLGIRIHDNVEIEFA